MKVSNAARTSIALPGLAALAVAGVGGSNAAPAAIGTPVRVAYTTTVLRSVSEGDAKAAIRVWGEALAKEMNVDAYSEAEVVPDAATLARRIREGQADLGSATALEFFEIDADVDLDPLLSLRRAGKPTVTYLLVVRGDGGLREVTDLRGTKLQVFDSPQGNLALPWLDLQLKERGLGTTSELFSEVKRSDKLSAVVLPVFFGQASACLVTRDGFETMAELNPQVGRDLRAIAESPGLVPVVSFLRRSFTPDFRENLIRSILNLSSSPTGRQVLNLIQSEGMDLLSPEDLKPTRELVRAWRRLQTREHATSSSQPAAPTLAGGAR